MFTLFYNMLKGTGYDFGGVLVFFLSEVLGSPSIGIAFGVVAVRWLRIVNRPLVVEDAIIQIAITIICAYLSFFIAQTNGLSGVLSCCAAGVVLAWLGPPLILNHGDIPS
jgi:NhaP-type Na+/H+ or K+/H+ antiporter